MFDIAPTEFLLVVVVALVVIGPKDLPKAMRFVGKWMGKARAMARHFRAGMDTMMREAELEELEKQWKAQNEEIMRQFPNASDMNSDKSGSSARREDGVNAPAIGAEDGVDDHVPATDNPSAPPNIGELAQSDFDAAAHSPSVKPSPADAENAQAETHKVPPRSSELP